MTSEVIQLLEYRLGEGGLLRRVEAACHLTRVRSQIVWAVLVTYVPIALLSLLVEARTGVREPLFYHAAVHVRLLVAVPILLTLDHVFPKICRKVLELLIEQDFIPLDALPRFERTLRTAVRSTDSALPELILALFAATVGIATVMGHVPVIGFTHRTPLSPAQVWYALLDVPLFQFLLWRSLWRWVVWARVLFNLARIPLQLVCTHPDRCGGIAFLRLPSIDYCAMLLFAASSVVCSEWGSYFEFGSSLATFKPLLIVFGAFATLLAFGPLLLFGPLLAHVRRAGLLEVGGVATDESRRFHRRWIEGKDRGGRNFGVEVQGLAAAAQTYRETVEQMRVVMFGKGDMITLLVATLLPSIPVIVMRVPKEDWLHLLSLLTGGFMG
jgi:hypothetical protein